jgi:alkylation response protein AidB-like acyl-CoA dehydrogenase
MDFSLSPEQQELRSSARHMMTRVATEEVLIAQQDRGTGYIARVWDQLSRAGWLGLGIPEDFGGSGASMSDFAVLLEEYGRGPLPQIFVVASVLAPLLILECGTTDQQERWLPAVAGGQERFTVAVTEDQHGWEKEHTDTTLTRDNGTLTVEGHKTFVPDIAGATKILVTARHRDTGNIVLVLVDPADPAVDHHLVEGLVSWQSDLSLNQVAVEPGDVVSAYTGDAWPGIRRAMLRCVPLLCSYQVGSCQAVFEMSLRHSRTRVQFGQPIGRFQRVQDHIIELVNHLDSARWATYEALWKWDTSAASAAASTYMAKAIVSEAHWQTCNYAHEVHAGLGVDTTYGLAKHTYLSRGLYHFLGDPRSNRAWMTRELSW